MLPILLSLGPVKIYSYGVVFAIGLFFALYWWWKMGRDEHFEEISLFDSFFLSFLVFLVVGRIGYVFFHFADLGTLYRSIALFAFPGIDSVIGILGSMIFLILFARAQGWDSWKLMDGFVVTLSLLLVFGSLAGFLNGSHPGRIVSWGLMYPGQSERRIPVDVFMFLWALITFGVVSSVRKNFRFYSWYKAEASVVREGLASLIFGLAVGVYYLISPWLFESVWRMGPVPGAFVVGDRDTDDEQLFDLSPRSPQDLGFGGTLARNVLASVTMGKTYKEGVNMQYPRNVLQPVVDYLKKLEHDLLHRKANLRKEDPFANESRLNDYESDDVVAEEQFGHAQTEALSAETSRGLKRVRGAMKRVDNGTYGKCTQCGTMIDTDRLGIDPTAEFCMDCAKKQ